MNRLVTCFGPILLGLLCVGCATAECRTGQVLANEACIVPEGDLTIALVSGSRSYLAFDPTVTEYAVPAGFLVSEIALRVTPSDAVETVSWRGVRQTLDDEGGATLSLDDGVSEFLRVLSTEGVTYEFEIRRAPAAELEEQAYLKSSNPREDVRFGLAVAASGDTVAVAEPSDPGGGRVIVFRLSEAGWSREAILESDMGSLLFGSGLALEGDTLVFGSSQGARIFVRSGAIWSLETELSTSGADGDGFGLSVDLSGDTIVVGAPGDSTDAESSGAAYVFVREESGWTEQAFLKADNVDADDLFGLQVAVAGDTIVVGCQRESGSAVGVNGADDNLSPQSGAAYVFVREGTTWSQQAYLKASNTGESDSFGTSVAIEGDTVVVGAPREDGSSTGINRNANDDAPGAGAVYVFVRQGAEWLQQAYIKASNTDTSDSFGSAVAVQGNTLAVGAEDEAGGDAGINVDQANNDAPETGAVYLFDRRGSGWSQKAYVKTSNSGEEDLFGGAVTLDGDTLVVGAGDEDGSAPNVDGADDDLVSNAGAAYVFR